MAGCAKGKRCWILSVLTAAFCFLPLLGASQAAPATPSESAEQGIPVTDSLTIAKCGTCHQPDAQHNLSRISWQRATAEGWEEAIKRMIRLNGLSLSPDDARHILRYLSDSHGLAPEEAQAVEYYSEQRMVDEKIADPEVAHACAACHEIARPLSWRRTPDDWKLLANMHIAYFPNIESEAFDARPGAEIPGNGGSGASGAPAAGSAENSGNGARGVSPLDKAMAFLAKSAPLHTAAWSEWESGMTTPKLGGRWLVTGEELGKGKFFGVMTIAPGAEAGNFTTSATLKFADGTTGSLTAKGASIVYTGFQWRGQSTVDGPGTRPGDPKTVREVMLVSPDQSSMEGRWFWGAYQEFGMDVKLRRASAGPVVLGTDVYSLRAGTTGNKVTIYGENLPQDVTAPQIDLGAGVKVAGIVNASPDAITISADVGADATPGRRTIYVGELAVPNALTVYKNVDFVKVAPVTAIAHLGSQPHPKGYVQFEATGYSFGPDGKPDTPDDINLGPMPALWKLGTYVATYGNDDIDFVGAIDPETGFFTPASDGPDPKRNQMRNNYGAVWATATVKPEGSTAPLTAKSYLIVAVPQYARWDEQEVER